jgi:hypothetical protein
MADLHADDVVVVGVEIGPAAKDAAADFVLANGGVWVCYDALAQIQKYFAQLRGFDKMAAGGDAERESPAFVVSEPVISKLGINIVSLNGIHTANPHADNIKDLSGMVVFT